MTMHTAKGFGMDKKGTQAHILLWPGFWVFGFTAFHVMLFLVLFFIVGEGAPAKPLTANHY